MLPPSLLLLSKASHRANSTEMDIRRAGSPVAWTRISNDHKERVYHLGREHASGARIVLDQVDPEVLKTKNYAYFEDSYLRDVLGSGWLVLPGVPENQ